MSNNRVIWLAEDDPPDAFPPVDNALREPDGLLDLSFVLEFDPLVQADGSGGAVTLYESDCSAPAGSTSCTPTVGATAVMTTYTSQTTGTCLAPVAGSTRAGYTPAIATPSAPCFVTAATDVTLTLGGIPITLSDAQVGGTYVGNPATSLSNGLVMGFLTETDADATVLPADLPVVGGQTLSSVLRGGTGNCSGSSDMDTHPTLGDGWWMYLNFPATEVPWTP